MFPKIGVKPPKWMVYFMENPMNKWMIWGGVPPIFGSTPILRELTWCDRPPWAKERSVQSTIMITRGLIMLACI